ncbi:hypothetical protein MASR2M15_16130 [Anaerolineales bacterium]
MVIRLLIVENNKYLASRMQKTLYQSNIESDICYTGQEALERIERKIYDCVLLDYHLPDMTGIRLIQSIKSQFEYLPITVMTSADDLRIAINVMQNGASDLVMKDEEDLFLKILGERIHTVVTMAYTTREKRNIEIQLALEQDRKNIITQVIRDISHEFRNPLTVIGTSTELIQSYTDNEKIQRHTERISAQVEVLERLIVMMSTLIKIQTRNELDLDTIEVRYLQEYIDHLIRTHPQKRLESEFDWLEALIQVDLNWLYIALNELIDNALLHSPPDSPVKIEMSTCTESLQIKIWNENVGPALEPEQIDHIFDRFYKAHSDTRKRGIGLGLAIVKLVIELHGGQIRFESEEKGTTITLLLPLYLVPESLS